MAIIDADMPTNVGASTAFTPKSRLPSARVDANATATPMTTPTADDARALHDHHPPNAPRLGAERHAHADLARALRDDVRQHAVEPDRAEDQRERRRDARASSIVNDSCTIESFAKPAIV